MGSATDSIREELIESLRPECAVCLLPYDDGGRIPRLLSCGHSISQDCADLLIDSNYSPAGGDAYVGFGRGDSAPQDTPQGSGLPSIPPEGLGKIVGARFGVVKCPECNQRTKVPAKGARGLAKNIELLRIISKLEGNDGSAKARKADLERKVNWAREIMSQNGADTGALQNSVNELGEGTPGTDSNQGARSEPSGSGQEEAVPEREESEEIQTDADSTSLSPSGGSGSELFQSAREGPELAVPSTAPSVDTLRSAFEAGREQQALGSDEPETAEARVGQDEIAELQTSPARRAPPPLEIPQVPQSGASVAAVDQNGEDPEAASAPEGAQSRPLTGLHGMICGHQDSVSALAVVADQWLCSASFDRTVRVWSLADGAPHGVLQGHQHRIMALATVSLLPEESAGVDEDGIICGNGRIIDNYVGGPDVVAGIPRGADLLVSADYGGQIKVWSVIRDTSVVRGPGESPEGEDKPGVSPGEPCPGPGKLLASWDAHVDWKYFGVLALAVAEGKVLYSGAGDRTIRAWSLGAGGVPLGGLLGVLEGHTGPVSALAVDGELLYSGSWDGSVRGWWREDHTPVAVVQAGPGPGVRCLSMVGPRLVAGRDDGTLQAWVEGQPESEQRRAHGGVVATMCTWGPFLYTGSWDGVIHVWRADAPFGNEAPLASIHVEGGPLAVVHSLVAARGRLFSAHLDTAIKVWTEARS